MGKIYLSSNDIEKIKQGEFLGKGKYAEVYDYDGKAIKIYKDNLEEKTIERIKKMSKYNNDTFIFPDDIVYIDNKIKAYTQEKFVGITLFQMFFAVLGNYYDIDIELLWHDYQKLKMGVREISEEHIIIYDLNDENILFNKGFKVVDTGNYEEDFKRDIEEIYKANIECVDDLFVYELKNINQKVTDNIQKIIGYNYRINYMDDFFCTMTEKLSYCKSLRDFKDYDFY